MTAEEQYRKMGEPSRQGDNNETSFGRDEVILEVEGTPLRCNKKELAKHSDYFKVMFEGNFVESTKKVVKLEVRIFAERRDVIIARFSFSAFP